MCKIWGIKCDAIAVALMHADLIVVDEERVIKEFLTQAELNYILLHEIGHNGKRNWPEQAAHDSAMGFARYYHIPVDYTCVELK